MAQLDKQYPYLHYSKAGAKCNLFEGQDGEEREDRDWIHMNAAFDDDDDDSDFSDDDDDDLDGIIIL